MVDVRWTGAAGLEFFHGGSSVLIDPYHSRPRKFAAFFGRLSPRVDAIERYVEGLTGKLSAIIVGHTHVDHALDIPEFAKRCDGPVVGSASLDTLVAMHGMAGRVTVCRGGEEIELPGSARVTMIPSRHGLVVFGRAPYPGEIDPKARPPLKASQYRHGSVFLPKLHMGGLVFMHVGSANFIEKELDGHRCDVLFMCVPGWKKVPGYTTRLLQIAKPRVVVPFHFDDFSAPMRPNMKAPPLPFQDHRGLMQQISQAAPSVEIRWPETFETMRFQ